MEEEENTKRSLFINPLEGYNKQRQQAIDTGAQFVDKVVTGGLEKINMPGSEFIGDRARNVAGFTADMLIPEDWEIPLIGAAAAIPVDGPLGEAAIYGTGVVNRVRRAAKGIKRASLANFSNVVDDAFSSANSLFNSRQPGWRLATANGADVGQELAEQSAQPMRMTGLDKTIRELPNTLDPRGLRNWGSDKRKAGARFITGKTVQDEHSFIQAGWEVLTTLNRNFGIDINRAISPFQVHHKGVIRQIAESANGLTDEAAKASGDYISKRVGFKMGYDPSNASPLPPKFHQRVHDIINNSISGRWGDNLEGLVQKLGLPPNWQTTMDLQARIDAGIYDEIADAINESTKAIDTFWKGVSTRTNLGKLSSDEFIDATFEVLKQDEILTNLRRTRSLSPEQGYNITQAVNELLEKAGRIDLQSPIFDKLTPEMTKEAYKFALQRNGWKAMKEVLISGQDSTTVFKAYGIKTKGFEEVLQQLGIPGVGKTKEIGTGSFLGRPKGSKTDPKKLQKQRKKKYDEDPDLNQGNTGRDETKPMDPPPDN